jgi:predicted nucleotidyltransferase
MSKDLEKMKVAILPVLERAGVTRSAFFGSVARGEAGSESDVDILIDFNGKKSLLDLVGLQQELEEVLGKRVDLVTYRSLYPRLRDIIAKDEVPIMQG